MNALQLSGVQLGCGSSGLSQGGLCLLRMLPPDILPPLTHQEGMIARPEFGRPVERRDEVPCDEKGHCTVIFLARPLFTLGYWCIYPKLWYLQVNKDKNLHYWKIRKTNSKNCKSISIKKLFCLRRIVSWHSSIIWMFCAPFKYENERKIGWNNWLRTW